MDIGKIKTLLESALNECKKEEAKSQCELTPPLFQVGDIVRLNWRSCAENNVAKVVPAPPGRPRLYDEAWFIEPGKKMSCFTKPENLTLLTPAPRLLKELDGISVGDVVVMKEWGGSDLYREVVLIDSTCSRHYGVYVQSTVHHMSIKSIIAWLSKEDITKVFKFPEVEGGR